jgi:GT2 family glycosyltransferase
MVFNKRSQDARVAVILLNWNGVHLTVPCINSLITGTVKPTTIIVVDNASTDRSIETLRASFADIDIVVNEKNLGFTGGNNVGFKRTLTGNYDFIWVLNNDTVVKDDCLKNLLQAMYDDSNIVAASGKILYEDPSDRIWYAGAEFSYWSLRTSHRGEMEKDIGQYNLPEDVPFISGCCIFMRSSALVTVGFFDNNFFAYSEDVDWCLRAKRLGLRLRYVPQAMIYHKVSASFKTVSTPKAGGTSSPFAIYLVTRNRMLLIRKHTTALQFLTASIAFFSRCFYYGLAYILLFRTTKLQSLCKGIIHGCFRTGSEVEKGY